MMKSHRTWEIDDVWNEYTNIFVHVVLTNECTNKLECKIWIDFNDITCLIFNIQGGFFFWLPPNFTKSQAHYKFLDLEKLGGGGQLNLYRAWDLVKLGGAQKKNPPCMLHKKFYLVQ